MRPTAAIGTPLPGAASEQSRTLANLGGPSRFATASSDRGVEPCRWSLSNGSHLAPSIPEDFLRATSKLRGLYVPMMIGCPLRCPSATFADRMSLLEHLPLPCEFLHFGNLRSRCTHPHGAGMIDLENLGKLVPKEALNKLYDDALSAPAKQLGKLGEDAMKTARLLLAPLQLAALAQDRFAAMIERISKSVPPERRIDPPAQIVGPVIEHLRFIDEDNPLSAMFEEILTNSIDKDGQEKVHPAFPHIISQLSRDEAWILFRLRDRSFDVVDHMDYDRATNQFSNRVIVSSTLPSNELFMGDKFELSFAHLEALGLVTWPVLKQTPMMAGNVQTGLTRNSSMKLTELGALFVKAAVPADGFERYAKRN
jgi:hypothetical protein